MKEINNSLRIIRLAETASTNNYMHDLLEKEALPEGVVIIADFQLHVGCRIYEDRIPIDYQTAAMAEEFNMNLLTAALNGGEDYELLFTVPLTDHEKIEKAEGIKLIGHITKPEYGNYLVGRDGGEVELKAQGWTAEKGM